MVPVFVIWYCPRCTVWHSSFFIWVALCMDSNRDDCQKPKCKQRSPHTGTLFNESVQQGIYPSCVVSLYIVSSLIPVAPCTEHPFIFPLRLCNGPQLPPVQFGPSGLRKKRAPPARPCLCVDLYDYCQGSRSASKYSSHTIQISSTTKRAINSWHSSFIQTSIMKIGGNMRTGCCFVADSINHSKQTMTQVMRSPDLTAFFEDFRHFFIFFYEIAHSPSSDSSQLAA